MNTLQIQDAFQPYYAGRDEPRDGADQTSPAKKPKDPGLSEQQRAARRIRDGFQASRRERKRDRD